MDNQPRSLVVMRHARAQDIAASDHERELTDRGRAAAEAAGAWLSTQGFAADHALVSTAARTRQTWQQVCRGAGRDLAPELDTSLYSADPESVLDVLRLVPATARSVVLVGHNPTVSQLAQLLSDGLGEGTAMAAMTRGYPPAALTLFEVHCEWSALSFGDARVTGFHVAGR